jgi:prefoldin subunit 5
MAQLFEQHVEKELKSMDQRLYELDERMTSIDSKLTQVVDAILGNPLTKSGGFVKELDDLKITIKDLEKRIKDQDEKIKEQEDFKKKIIWGITLIIAVGAFVQYLINIYSKLK